MEDVFVYLGQLPDDGALTDPTSSTFQIIPSKRALQLQDDILRTIDVENLANRFFWCSMLPAIAGLITLPVELQYLKFVFAAAPVLLLATDIIIKKRVESLYDKLGDVHDVYTDIVDTDLTEAHIGNYNN